MSTQQPIEQTNANSPAPQRIMYTKPKKSSTWIKVLAGLGVVFLPFVCTCVIGLVVIGSFSTAIESTAAYDTTILEERILTTGNTGASETRNIAVINISGPVTYSIPGSTGDLGASSNTIISQLERAKDDEKIDVVLLRFNTPGGEVSAAEPICRSIQELHAEKPVYSFIDTMGASLGYLLPNCSQYIYSRPSAITGSIGVILQAIDFLGILENIGGQVIYITNSEGEFKSGEEIFDKNSQTYNTYQEILDETYNYFVDVVVEGREMAVANFTREDLLPYADGRILSGKQALEVKLVDELGQFEDVIASIIQKESVLQGTKVNVMEYVIPVNPFADLFRGLQGTLESTDLEVQQEKYSGFKLHMRSDMVSFDQVQRQRSKEQ